MVLLFEANGTIRYISPSVKKVLGYNPEEIIGSEAFEHVHPEDLKQAKRTFARVLRSPGDQAILEIRLQHWDGSWRYMEVVHNNLLADPTVRGIVVNCQDVTDRKRGEEKLKESEERFRVQFKGSPIPAYAWLRVDDEDDFVFIDHNDAASTITEGNIANLLGTRVSALYPDRPSWVQKRFRHCFQEHTSLKEEAWWTFTSTGETRYLLIHFVFVPPKLVMVYTEDLTERKEAEEAVRRSEERFRLLAENAQDFIFRFSFKPTPTFEYVSPSASVLTGYSPEEYYADPELGLKIVYPDDRYLIDEVLRSPKAFVTIRWRRKDSRLVWVEQHSTPIYDETGDMVAIEGIGRDVTDRRRAEEELRSSEEFFRALYEEMNHPIFLVDEDLNFVDVNPYACEFYGYSREEFKHMKLQDITLPEERDEHLRNVEELSEQGKMFVLERRHRKRNCEVVTVTVDVTRVTRSEQELYVRKITDITARVQLEERLRYQAFHDSLTGLLNHDLFMDRQGRRSSAPGGDQIAE